MIRTFEGKKWEVMLAREEFCMHLEGEANRLISKIIDPGLDAFRTNLAREVSTFVERHYTTDQTLAALKVSKTLVQQLKG
jgi:hypothetical protein